MYYPHKLSTSEFMTLISEIKEKLKITKLYTCSKPPTHILSASEFSRFKLWLLNRLDEIETLIVNNIP
ncbi:hypothetical protein LCGC14_2976440 [marine sediment metagenome]|uniref:Uncharacterized protein n=1 Tax=marine sediment metagenome TaxID=412755 RepID=A0A0F8ZZ46_9ZZZZ